jgi:hypothetical protein
MRKPFNQFLAIMFGKDVLREGSALADIRPFFLDATGKENSWNDYMFNACMYAMLYGNVYTLVDYIAPEAEAGQEITLADLDEGNVFPSVTMFSPISMQNWNYIPRKGFEACVFKQRKYLEGRMQDTLLYVDYDTIVECDGQGKPLPNGEFQHTLGYTPVFTLSYNGTAGIDAALGSLMAPAQKGVTNLCSIVDEMSERQAFSQLCFPDDGTMAELEHRQSDILKVKIASGEISASANLNATDSVLRMLSDSAALTWPAGTGHPPQFISPNATELKNIWRAIKEILTQAVMSTGLTDHRGNVTLESCASVMKVFSTSAAAHEEKVLKTVVRYQGSGNIDDISVTYPKVPTEFDTQWINTCTQIASATWLSDEAKVELIKGYVISNADNIPLALVNSVLNGVEIVQQEINDSPFNKASKTPE